MQFSYSYKNLRTFSFLFCALSLFSSAYGSHSNNFNNNDSKMSIAIAGETQAKVRDNDQAKANVGTLQQVQILFRHGERTAIEPLPSDSDPKVLAEMKLDGADDWGRLTNNGKKQLFELGEYFRRRYAGFVKEEYDSKQVYILSSDSDRTLKSAGACMLGFYKKFHEIALWNPAFSKTVEPIPIRTLPAKEDRMLKNVEKCPAKEERFTEIVTEGPVWKPLQESELFIYIRKHSANPVLNDPAASAYSKFYNYIGIQDNLVIKKLRNKTRPTEIPDWALPLYDNPEFMNAKGKLQLTELPTVREKRLTSGPLFQYLRDNIDRRISEEKGSKKMIFLSGHDRNMASLLTSLGMFEPNPEVGGLPSFASSLMIELHKSPADEYYLEFYLRNDTSREPYFLPIPNCGDPCSYTTFKNEIIGDLIPSDWHEECLLSSNNESYAKNENGRQLTKDKDNGIQMGTSSTTKFEPHHFLLSTLSLCILVDYFTRKINQNQLFKLE